jgi:alcohol dehydrogenase (quinone), cytochrome c subunit
MPPFCNQLSDQEISDVLSFIRTSWGNKGGMVNPDEAKALRDRTSPASATSLFIVLQMR